LAVLAAAPYFISLHLFPSFLCVLYFYLPLSLLGPAAAPLPLTKSCDKSRPQQQQRHQLRAIVVNFAMTQKRKGTPPHAILGSCFFGENVSPLLKMIPKKSFHFRPFLF
jgi:hypothetical protein